jgi:hypothetical protein
LQESLAEQLEEGYKSEVWAPAKGHVEMHGDLSAARLDLNSSVFKGLFALFVSVEEAYLCKQNTMSWLWKLGGSSVAGGGTAFRLRLRRGYRPPDAKVRLSGWVCWRLG